MKYPINADDKFGRNVYAMQNRWEWAISRPSVVEVDDEGCQERRQRDHDHIEAEVGT